MPKRNSKLTIEQLRRTCDPGLFEFDSTETLSPLEEIIGQDRAVRSVSFGIDIESPGYHMYALGPAGTGKTTIIKQFLDRKAAAQPVPDDWCYVNNFKDADKPRALRLPAGKGRAFQQDMEQLVKDLTAAIPQVFESQAYQEQQQQAEKAFQDQRQSLFDELSAKAETRGFTLLPSPQGILFLPMVDGKVLSPEQLGQLGEAERERIGKQMDSLQDETREMLRRARVLQKEERERLQVLDRQVVDYATQHLLEELHKKYTDLQAIVQFLDEVHTNILENVQTFKSLDQPQPESLPQKMGVPRPTFNQYRVNLIVDNSASRGAPVVLEGNPGYYNLLGRVEHEVQFGALVTNFSMIKGGAFHRANGGYLMVEAKDILTKPFAWDALKRALKSREIRIQIMGQDFQVVSTRTLEPEPIPLDIKTIIVGDPVSYYTLYQLDEDFQELFKVKLDFAVQMDWTPENARKYAQFIGGICRDEKLRHFTPAGVAKVVEHSARLVSHREKLSAKFGDVVDLIRQSSYWAAQNDHNLITGDDVHKAIREHVYRSNQLEERLRELVDEKTVMIDTSGKVVGQVNGLSVMPLGGYSFGHPSRITARTYVGSSGVVNIEREIEMGGPIHNKATLILEGYLGGKYAGDRPLALSASITFEQMYEEIEGDSAAAAELYALLSSLSGIPIKQNLAVTGSINQRGEVQAIGGVNEKIEGFFDVCRLKGLTGDQGVLIPQSNVRHLMLREDVVGAVQDGKFSIYAVANVDEGIELLTGKKAGVLGADGLYPEGSINAAVQARLTELADKVRAFAPGASAETA